MDTSGVVVVTVTGKRRETAVAAQYFTQTFYLACEARRYYVFNDLLRMGYPVRACVRSSARRAAGGRIPTPRFPRQNSHAGCLAFP